ncbi:MAG: 2,3-bisphosphoglycerate-independent phosphoglycerate mutase [Gemmatimonadota bacterium]
MPGRRVGLIILDGWGLREATDGNAVALARTPVFDALRAAHPFTRLEASGPAVGLDPGRMGNSEVGHLNLGAGRIVKQDILTVFEAIASGAFFELAPFHGAVEHVGRTGGTLHLMGLVSDGGVHSHVEHLISLLEFARRQGASRVAVHAFTDGRDTAPQGGAGYLESVAQAIAERRTGSVATIVGRYFAMDRDKRWERTRVAYEALTDGRGCTPAADPIAALRASYAAGVTDEFVEPICVPGTPRVAAGDAIIFFNFRADRARQLTRAFTDPGFDGFDRPLLDDLYFARMTVYEGGTDLPTAFAAKELGDIAADVWERAGCSTLRIAETEKYAHVTYFFNGGRERPYAGEERILIPSPKVATYDLQPEMSAAGVADRLVERIGARAHEVFICNFANPDMVGHTGVLDAAIQAVETVDGCLGRVVEAFRTAEPDGALLILADHGNAETMIAEDGSPHTAHTTNPVPCLLVADGESGPLRAGGALCDAVPTLLALQAIEQPEAMGGRDLRQR